LTSVVTQRYVCDRQLYAVLIAAIGGGQLFVGPVKAKFHYAILDADMFEAGPASSC